MDFSNGQKEDNLDIKKKPSCLFLTTWLFFGDPGEIRTHDPMIKSHLLYQLSYGVILVFVLQWVCFPFAMQSYALFLESPNFLAKK